MAFSGMDLFVELIIASSCTFVASRVRPYVNKLAREMSDSVRPLFLTLSFRHFWMIWDFISLSLLVKLQYLLTYRAAHWAAE